MIALLVFIFVITVFSIHILRDGRDEETARPCQSDEHRRHLKD